MIVGLMAAAAGLNPWHSLLKMAVNIDGDQR
jgi:hypothetical protein